MTSEVQTQSHATLGTTPRGEDAMPPPSSWWRTPRSHSFDKSWVGLLLLRSRVTLVYLLTDSLDFPIHPQSRFGSLQ